MEKTIGTKRKVARVIREQRRKLEITQQSLADAIGYSDAFISDLEAAKSSLPTECIPLLVDKLRFKSVSDFWQRVLQVEVNFADDGWSE